MPKRGDAMPGGLLGHQRNDGPVLPQDAATESSSGPLPATMTRLPLTGKPDLTNACNPPAPTTFGKVQPGKGRNRSRAPVARISFS